ncbi:hypothetical protein ACP70R_021182 [Stipagrostis hirtigluma subsp. patula]
MRVRPEPKRPPAGAANDRVSAARSANLDVYSGEPSEFAGAAHLAPRQCTHGGAAPVSEPTAAIDRVSRARSANLVVCSGEPSEFAGAAYLAPLQCTHGGAAPVSEPDAAHRDLTVVLLQ